MDPNQLKFTESDEWLHIENGVATIGITDQAVNALTDLVFIELPPVGKTLNTGSPFGVVESVKAASDLYSPVAGEVVESNGRLADDLGVLSADPFGAGWLIKVKLSHALPSTLMTRSQYNDHWNSRH